MTGSDPVTVVHDVAAKVGLGLDSGSPTAAVGQGSSGRQQRSRLAQAEGNRGGEHGEAHAPEGPQEKSMAH